MSSVLIMFFSILLFAASGHILIRELTRSTILQAAQMNYSRTALKIGKAYKVLAALFLTAFMLVLMMDAGKAILFGELPF